MKTLVCLFTVLVSASSFAVELPALPPSEYADTEVSTNFVFAVGEGGGRRLVFSLELEAGTTNNVEVAIGCDADCDGWLSLDETALAVGYDDLGDWDGAAKLEPEVYIEATDDPTTMRFTVKPGDGTSPCAFLQIKR